MSRLTVWAIRIVLIITFLGSLFVHAVMIPLIGADLADLRPAYEYLRVPIIVIAAVGVLTIEVAVVCVWQLVSMARRGTVFSQRSFRYVDITIAAISVAAALVFVFAALIAPGEAAAPGVVLLIGGVGLLITGVALIVVVLRALLAQAVAKDVEASHLKAELDEVI